MTQASQLASVDAVYTNICNRITVISASSEASPRWFAGFSVLLISLYIGTGFVSKSDLTYLAIKGWIPWIALFVTILFLVYEKGLEWQVADLLKKGAALESAPGYISSYTNGRYFGLTIPQWAYMVGMVVSLYMLGNQYFDIYAKYIMPLFNGVHVSVHG